MKKIIDIILVIFILCTVSVALFSCGSDETENLNKDETKYLNNDDLFFASGCDFTLIENYFKENGNESDEKYIISGTRGQTAYSITYSSPYKQMEVISAYSTKESLLGIAYEYTYCGAIQINLNESLTKAKYVGQYDHQALDVYSGAISYYTADFTFKDVKYISLTDVTDYKNISCSGEITSASNRRLANKHFNKDEIGSKCYERIEECLVALDNLFKSIDENYKIANKYIDPTKCNHVSVTNKGIPPTCLEDGLTDGEHCKICNIVLEEKKSIPARGHNSVVISGYSATCTENGLTDGEECSTCGTVIIEQSEIPAGHNYVNRECVACHKLEPSQGLTFTSAYLDGYGSCYGVSGIGSCTDSLLVIPDTYNDLPVKVISNEAFKGNNLIEKVVMTDNITHIGKLAFYECKNLNNIILSQSLDSIGSNAFYDTGIYNNTSNWNNGVLYIDNYLIKATKELTGDYEVKNGTVLISDSAFYLCENLSAVILPDSVLYINAHAFSYCKSLVLVEMSRNILEIEEYAFNRCGISDIYIPKTIKFIGYDAFTYPLQSVNYEGTVSDWHQINIKNRFYNCQIICSNGVI